MLFRSLATFQNFRFLQQLLWGLPSSGMSCHVVC